MEMEALWGRGGGPIGEPREVGNGVLGTGVGVLESSHQGVGHCSHISPQKARLELGLRPNQETPEYLVKEVRSGWARPRRGRSPQRTQGWSGHAMGRAFCPQKLQTGSLGDRWTA